MAITFQALPEQNGEFAIRVYHDNGHAGIGAANASEEAFLIVASLNASMENDEVRKGWERYCDVPQSELAKRANG